MKEFETRMRASAPDRVSEAPGAAAAARELVTEMRAEAARQRQTRLRKRLVLGIPAAVLGVGLLTAGAVVVINEMPVITTIPVTYTTDTGKTVTCHVDIEGSGDDPATTRQIADFVNATDWTGIGQRIYDRAIADPWAPNPKDSYVDADGVEHQGSPPMTAAEQDHESWMRAMSELVPGPLPDSILASSPTVSWGWGSDDCDGVLH